MDGKSDSTGKSSASSDGRTTKKVVDLCERVRQEFILLEGQSVTSKAEIDKLKTESLELQRALKQMHDMVYPLQVEIAKQTELKNRMLIILNQVVEALPEEAQVNLRANIERAKNLPIETTASLSQTQHHIQHSQTQQHQLQQAHHLHPQSQSSQQSTNKKIASVTDLTQDNVKKQKVDSENGGNGYEPSQTASRAFSVESQSQLDDLIHSSLRQNISTTNTAISSSLNATTGRSSGMLGGLPYGSSTLKDAPSKWNSNSHLPGMTPPSPLSPTANDGNKPHRQSSSNNNPSLPLPVPTFKAKSSALASATAPALTQPSTPLQMPSPVAPTPRSVSPTLPTASLAGSAAPVAAVSSSAGIPKSSRFTTFLPHGGVVCAATFNNLNNNVYTCGKGCVKVWDINSAAKPLTVINCLNDSYIRSCKLSSGGKALVLAGETNLINVWDLEANKLKHNISTNVSSTFGLSSALETSVFYSCHNDGTIRGWDTNTGKQIRQLIGHQDGVSSIEMTADGTKLISGGLDSTLRVWDLPSGAELASYHFPSQIYCLGVCPGESWLAVGMENSMIEVLTLLNSNCKYQLKLHENCILSLKFSNNGKWFISTAKDKVLTAWRSPFGSSIFQTKEPNAILCSDISSDDHYIVTGSSDRFASVYEVLY